MKTAMVFGAGGGIGSALVDGLLNDSAYAKVLAVSRHPASELNNSLHWICENQIPNVALAKKLQSHCDGIDHLFVASGILRNESAYPEKNLSQIHAETLQSAFEVNAVAPILLIKACMPLLNRVPSVILVLSAKVGSIEDNRYSGWYGYRMSKAALNMGIKTLGIELARRKNHPHLLAVHPGTTRTALSGKYLHRDTPHASATITAQRLIRLAQQDNESRHGSFVHWDGSALPW